MAVFLFSFAFAFALFINICWSVDFELSIDYLMGNLGGGFGLLFFSLRNKSFSFLIF